MAISDFSNQLKTLFTSLSPAKRFTLIGLAVATFAAFIFMAFWTGTPDYQLLYSNLSPEDAGIHYHFPEREENSLQNHRGRQCHHDSRGAD